MDPPSGTEVIVHLLVCRLSIAVLLLSFYMYFVKLTVVVEDLGIGAAFGRAWRVLRMSIGPIILIGLIVYVVGFRAGLLSTALTAPMRGLFLAGVWPVITDTGSINLPFLYAAGILFLASLPVGWFISAVQETWVNAVYTLVNRQLIQPPPAPLSTV